MSEVQVRIRHYDEADSVPFTTSRLDALQDVINRVVAWGGVYRDGTSFTNLEGQFVLDESGAYFEIVLNEGDE